MKRVNVENFILFYLFIHLFITRSTRLLYRRKISIEIKKKVEIYILFIGFNSSKCMK